MTSFRNIAKKAKKIESKNPLKIVKSLHKLSF